MRAADPQGSSVGDWVPPFEEPREPKSFGFLPDVHDLMSQLIHRYERHEHRTM